MNDKFDFKRFISYAKKHYWDNRVVYGIVILTVFLLTIFTGAKGHVTSMYNASALRDATSYVSSNFIGTFLFLGALFTAIFIFRSLSGYKAKNLSINDMLLPVSNLERFVFALIHSTIVAFTVFSLVFCLATSYVELLYSFDPTNQHYYFSGIFGLGRIEIAPNELSTYTHKELFSLWDTVFYSKHMQSKYLFAFRSLTISAYFYFVAVIMWGVVTFKKHSLILNILIHGLFLVLFAAVGNKIINLILGYNNYLMPIYVADNDFRFRHLIYDLSPIMLIPAIVYFVITWLKLKNLSLYK